MTVVYLDSASTLSQILMTAAFSMGTFLTVASSDDLERVLGMAVLDGLDAIHLSVKEAAPIMRVDEANLRSMLRGESRYHLGLIHIARLPFKFWYWFGPVLFALLLKRSLAALVEDSSLRKSA